MNGAADLVEVLYQVLRRAVRDGVEEALRATGLADPRTASGRYLTTREAADRLRVHPQTVYDLVRQGRIHSVRLGKRILIPENALGQFDGGEQSG